MEQNTIFCANCGTRNEGSALFCSNCGSNLGEQKPSKENTSYLPSNSYVQPDPSTHGYVYNTYFQGPLKPLVGLIPPIRNAFWWNFGPILGVIASLLIMFTSIFYLNFSEIGLILPFFAILSFGILKLVYLYYNLSDLENCKYISNHYGKNPYKGETNPVLYLGISLVFSLFMYALFYIKYQDFHDLVKYDNAYLNNKPLTGLAYILILIGLPILMVIGFVWLIFLANFTMLPIAVILLILGGLLPIYYDYRWQLAMNEYIGFLNQKYKVNVGLAGY